MSRSFSRPITTLEELRQAVATYVVRAAEKLRKQHQRAAALTVYTRTSPFIPAFYSQAASTRRICPATTPPFCWRQRSPWWTASSGHTDSW